MRYLLSACAVVGGCSSVLGIDSNRHLVDAAPEAALIQDGGPDATHDPPDAPAAHDAKATTVEGGMPWGCLGAPAPAPPAMATLRFALGNAATGATGAMPDGQPAAGLVIRACRPLDFTCDEPLATSLPTDDAGQTTLIVPGGFDGYFEMPDAAGFVPAIYWHAPIQGSQLDDQAVLPPNLVALAAELVEVTVEGDAGTVIPIVLDCNGVAAAGVRFNLSDLAPSEHFFYLNDSVPSHTATATDSTGGALLFNAPPGTITMTATTPGGQLIGSSTTEVRAGWATFVQFTPSQAKLSPP